MLVYLGIGSNQGDSLAILRESLLEIKKHLGSIVCASSVYSTQAWGKKDQNDFLNQVIGVEVPESAFCKNNYQEMCYNILQKIHEIEAFFGRKRTERWGARTLDIDILFANDYIVNTENLVIPHVEIPNRRFVLVPINEIAPNFVHPILKIKIKDMLDSCSDESNIKLLLGN